MSINALYDHGENSFYCFQKIINMTTRVEIDFLQAQIFK